MAPQKDMSIAEAQQWIRNALLRVAVVLPQSTDDLDQDFFDETRPVDFKETKKSSTSSDASDRSEERYDPERCDARASKKKQGVRFEFQCSSKKRDGKCLCKNHLNKFQSDKGLELGLITEERPTHWPGSSNDEGKVISWHDADPGLLATLKKTAKKTPKNVKKVSGGATCLKTKHLKGTMNINSNKNMIQGSNSADANKGNDKRINSCKQVGGKHKKEGHKKEETFNAKYNPECKSLTMKAESDCEISEEHPILDKLMEKGIIKCKKEKNTSNKSGGSIQLTLGNIPELSGEENLEWIENNDNLKILLEKYMKKNGSNRPADLLVYDNGESRLFFGMDDIIKYMVENCKFRKTPRETCCIKGDFIDESSKTGKRALFTYEYRKTHKSHFLGFSGGQGKTFIELLNTKIKYYEDPY